MWVRVVLIVFLMKIMWCAHEKMPYVEYQRSTVDYNDPDFMDNITFMTRRYNRKNPLYYVTIYSTLMKPLDNSYAMISLRLFGPFFNTEYDNTTEILQTQPTLKPVHINVFPLMSIVHQRSIFEVHSKWCDFVDGENIFVKVLKKTQFKKFLVCPVSAGKYAVTNMTTSYGQYLKAFPFTQGRIVWNITDYRDKRVLGCHIDMEIKEMSASQFYKLMQ